MVIVFGVTLASAVTLYVVPLLYGWLAPDTGSPQAIARRLAALLGRQRASEPPAPLLAAAE